MTFNSTNFSFKVGKREVSKIDWKLRLPVLLQGGRVVTIKVNNEPIDLPYLKSCFLPFVKTKFNFKVGKKEKHTINMTWKIPLLYPYFGKLWNEVYVDDKLYTKYEYL